MTYPEFFVAPMRAELTSHGVEELRTAEDVDAAVRGQVDGVVGRRADVTARGLTGKRRHRHQNDQRDHRGDADREHEAPARVDREAPPEL